MTFRMAYPLRCPYCRDRLQCRHNRLMGFYRWCRRHQCVVSYVFEDADEYVAAHW